MTTQTVENKKFKRYLEGDLNKLHQDLSECF